jgi:hypothetical protein
MSGSQCPERKRTVYHGEVRCQEPEGHEKAHYVNGPDGKLQCAWVTREEFEAARARGEFDREDYCRCADPIPVCDACGGEIR